MLYQRSMNKLGSLEIVGPQCGNLHVVGGYAYNVNKFIGKRRYLKCVEARKLNCKGTIVLIMNEKPRRNGRHNHPPDYLLGIKYQIIRALKDTAHVMYDSTPEEVYSIVAHTYSETESLFPFTEVKDMIKRQSKLTTKTETVNRQPLTFVQIKGDVD